MMQDRYSRHISYLRISVTDRCNLKCDYCMPLRAVKHLKPELLLSGNEITAIAKEAAGLGISKIRLTGGEPLMRKDIVEIVRGIAGVDGIDDLSLTTNGTLLQGLAAPLAEAGLMRVNISLDTVRKEQYRKITRVGELQKVLEGIEAARQSGLQPVKINCVIDSSMFEKDAREVADFCRENGLQVRFIPKMNLETGKFSRVIGGEGGDCRNCNRLRITAEGIVKPCLFSNMGYSIRQFGVREALIQAVQAKPESGSINTRHTFYNIGG